MSMNQNNNLKQFSKLNHNKNSNKQILNKNKYIKWISFILLFIFILYILIVTNNLITVINFCNNYRIYMHIWLIFASFVLILHFILNLYILHKFIIMNNKGEEITISPVFPNFIIEYLKDLKLYSKDAEVVKSVKLSYYVQIILYTIMFVWTIILLFLI